MMGVENCWMLRKYEKRRETKRRTRESHIIITIFPVYFFIFCNLRTNRFVASFRDGQNAELWKAIQEIAIGKNGVGFAEVSTNEVHDLRQLRFILVIHKPNAGNVAAIVAGRCTCAVVIACRHGRLIAHG